MARAQLKMRHFLSRYFLISYPIKETLARRVKNIGRCSSFMHWTDIVMPVLTYLGMSLEDQIRAAA